VEKRCRAGQATDDDMAHALCMLNIKATKTHSEYVIFTAFPGQQWLNELASLLRYTTLPVLSRWIFLFVSDFRFNGSCTISS